MSIFKSCKAQSRFAAIDWKADPDELLAHFAPYATPEGLAYLQGVVYVMCGGSFTGEFAASQPGAFYIDDRVRGLPYGKGAILQAVKVLDYVARSMGYDTRSGRDLPSRPRWPSLGLY